MTPGVEPSQSKKLVPLVFRRVACAACADGLLLGLARLALGTLCVAALLRACGGGLAASGLLMASVFALGLGALGGWNVLRLLVAPEQALWEAEPGWRWPRRLGLTACALVAGWFFWTCLTAGLLPHGGLVAGVPLAAALVQRGCRRGRGSDGPDAGRGWRDVSKP